MACVESSGQAGEWEIQQQLQEAIRIRAGHATGGASSQCERKLGFPRWWAATKQEKEIYASREFLESTWGRTCFEWLQETAPNQKAGATWCATFLLRMGLSREELTKWLRNKGVTWKKKRRLIQAITLTFPCSKWLCRIGSKSNAACALCERYQRNLNPDARQRTAIGTFGHIQSAGCLGTREAVIAAHNKCLNGLIEDICRHQVKRWALRLIAEDKDKSLRSLWEDETLQEICSQEELWAAVAAHARRLLEAQDAVLLAYYGGLQQESSVTVRHHLGQDIYG